MALQRRIDKIEASENKGEAYSTLMTELLNDEGEASLKTLVEHLVKQNHVSMRPAYKTLVDFVTTRRKASGGRPYVGFLEAAISTLAAANHQSLEEHINMLRYNLAKIYQLELEADDEESFVKAARHLGKMSLDNAPVLLKVKAWVRAAQLYVADSLFREAEIFCTKLGNILKFGAGGKLDEKYKRRYMSANASVLDYFGKYHVAANEYMKLSALCPDEEEAKAKLSKGLKCVLLAPGSSLLATYYKSERCAGLPGFNLVEKMFLQRFIEKKDYESFAETLEPHQQKTTREGWTLLEQAVIEVNLVAASNVYTNIAMSNLGEVLGVTTEKAEEISSKMITEGRLKGTIDQRRGTLQFTPLDYSQLSDWDKHVGIACTSVNHIFDRLTTLHPAWVDSQFA